MEVAAGCSDMRRKLLLLVAAGCLRAEPWGEEWLEEEAAWKEAGVDRFVHVGVDVVAVLRDALQIMIRPDEASTVEEVER